MGNNSKEMERFGISGFGCEYGLVDLCGIIEPAVAMMFQGAGQV
jgi:hypothetical protein